MLKVGHTSLIKHNIMSKDFNPNEEVQNTNQLSWNHQPLRVKSSADGPKLPEDFKVSEAAAGGDCFFDAVGLGLRQLKPQLRITVKSLRKVCKYLAEGNERLKSKIIADARNSLDTRIIRPDNNISDDELWNAYLDRIEYDRDDITKIQKDNPSLYQTLTSSVYGSTLHVPIWGRPDIEGQIICQNFDIKLHVIEKSIIHELWLEQIVDKTGSRSVGHVDYSNTNTIHIVNKGNDHFQPILRTHEIQHGIQQHPSDYDDDVLTPEEQLINIIKGQIGSEEEKLEGIERLFQDEQRPNVNFQDEKGDTPLHFAVRRGYKHIVVFLIKKGAQIDSLHNRNGRTPLDAARKRDRKDIVEVLERHLELSQQISTGEQSVNRQVIPEIDSRELKEDGSTQKRRKLSPSGNLEEFAGAKKLHVEDNTLENKEQTRDKNQQYTANKQLFVNNPILGLDINSQPLPTATNRVVKWIGWYTKEQIRAYPDLLFLFGDNDSAKYRQNADNPHGGGQATATRPNNDRPYDRLPKDGGVNGNAIGITTTFYGGYTPNLGEFRVLMDKEFEPIKTWVVKGGCVVVPSQTNGHHNLGTGIANLKKEYLECIQQKIDGLIELGKRKPEHVPNIVELKEELHESLSKERKYFHSLRSLQTYVSSDQQSVHQQLQHKRAREDSEKEDHNEGDSKKPKEEILELEEENNKETVLETSKTELQISSENLKGGNYAASGLKLSLHGNVYQLKLLMLFLNRGLNQNYPFLLATEMDDAEKFDDLVFKYINEGDGKIIYRFLQAKHKQDESRKISINDLLTQRDGEFSLQKYFISYRKINQNPEFSAENIELQDFIIYTNIDLHEDLHHSFTLVDSEDRILDVTSNKDSKLLKLDIEKFPDKEGLLTVIKETSDLNRLTKHLAEYILNGKQLDLKDELFKLYHGALAKYVIDVPKGKFFDTFFDEDMKDKNLETFRGAFLENFGKLKQQTDVDTLMQDLSSTRIQLSKNFGKVFELSSNLEFNNKELDEFVNAFAGAISKAEDGIVKIRREGGKGKGVIKDNIAKLAGHVLVKRDEKEKNVYYFSSAFLDEGIVMPGDLELFRSELITNLQGKGIILDKDTYRFHIANFATCKEEEINVKPSLPNDTVTDEDIEKFLDKLIFAVNQPNEMELTKIIVEELGEEFISIENESVYNTLQTEMLDWMKEKQGRFFTHEDGKGFFERMRRSLSKVELRSLALECRDFIDDIGIEFTKRLTRLESFLTANDKQIFNIVCKKEPMLGAIKVYQILQDIPQFSKIEDYIFLRWRSLEGHRIKEKALSAFKLSRCTLLILECKATVGNVHSFYERLSEILRSSNEKKIILISQGGNPLIDKFKRGFSRDKRYEEIEDEHNNLTELTISSQDEVLNKGKAIFQGNEVILRSLIDDKSKFVIDEEIMAKLVNKKKVKIGEAPYGLGEIKYYYIDRIFNRQMVIKKEYFKAKSVDDFVVVSNIETSELSALTNGEKARHILSVDTDILNPIKFIALDSGEDMHESIELLRETYKQYNIHWLRKENEKFVWQETFGSLSNLRAFVDSGHTAEYTTNEITSISGRIVIVSAEPGMGKTTVLTKLARKMKNYNHSLWIVRVDLNDHTKLLKEVDFNNSRDEAIDFLSGIADLKTPLERELFRYRINNQGKIGLLFDGFDEIAPTYEDKVIELLKILKDTKVEKLWVTTRPHMRSELEDKLSVLSYTLKPLSPDDQKEFLKRYWSKKLNLDLNSDDNRLNIYVEGILDVLSNSIVDKEKQFTGIPLQTRLLAEAFQDKFKEFYYSDEAKPNLPERLNLVELYHLFVRKKYDIYCEEKKKEDLTNPGVRRDYKKLYKDFILEHKLMALVVMLPDKDVDIFLNQEAKSKLQAPMKDVKKGEERTGIVNQLINGRPVFMHRTFAEYFAASWFVDNVGERFEHDKIFDKRVEDLLRNTLFENGNEVLRNFFDRMLARDDHDVTKYELQDTVLNNDKAKTQELLEDYKNINDVDKGGRTSLHLAASYGYTDIVKVLLDHESVIDTKDNIFGWSPLRYADKTSHWDVAEILLRKGANSGDMFEAIKETKEDLKSPDLKETLLHTAAEKDFKEFAKVLIENGADIKRIGPNEENSLHIAAGKGNLEIVRYFVETDSSLLNIKDQRMGMSPLHFAANTGKLNTVKYIIENGGYGQEISGKGKTVLHFAANAGNLDLVEYIVRQKVCNVNSKDNDGMTSLHFAAASGNLGIVKYLIEEASCDVHAVDKRNTTLVHFAARSGNLDLVKYLVDDKGLDFNTQDTYEQTPLHRAADYGHMDIVKYLLHQKGLDISIKSHSGRTPLHFAVASGNLNLAKYFIEEMNSNPHSVDLSGATLIHVVIGSGNMELLKYLVDEKGVSFNTKDKNGEIPLHWAAECGYLSIVKFFVDEKGVDVNIQTQYGKTPLHFAAENGALKLVKYLIDEKQADIQLTDDNGDSFLHYACEYGHLDVLQYLVNKKGIDFKVKNKFGETILHRAAQHGKWPIVKYLLDEGIFDVDIRTFNGMTPLHFAAVSGNLKLVKSLIDEKGADSYLADENGTTVVQFAGDSGNVDILKYLVYEKGLDLKTEDNFGKTVLHRAAQYGKLSIIKYLLNEEGFDVDIRTLNGMTSLHFAAAYGKLNVLEYLIDKKNSDIHLADENGTTVVQFASDSGNVDILKHLVSKKGLDLKIQDNFGKTVLHRAAQYGKLDIIKYLLNEEGFDVDIQTLNGMTPLHFAVASGNLDLVKYLIEKKGANVNAKSNDNRTTLNFAIEGSHLDIIKYVLFVAADALEENMFYTMLNQAVGTNNRDILELILESIKEKDKNMARYINFKDAEGNTPLILAARNGSLIAAEVLLHYEASVNIENNDGETALHLAVKGGYKSIVKLLLEKYANRSSRDKNSKTPLDLAEEQLLQDPSNHNVNIIRRWLLKGTASDFASFDDCLPTISYNRNKRNAESECLFSWQDVDEFNVEEDEKRDFNKISIDSEKFISYIKDQSQEKRRQLISLADVVEVTGKSKRLVYQLTNNEKVMNHFQRVEKISGLTMHGMMAKNALSDFLNGDYQGVAINLGFIAGGRAFSKIAEVSSLKGIELAAEGKSLLGRSLRAASPFLGRGTSAFVIYDLVNQVKEFRHGTEESLVGIVGDSLYLGVDAAEIGVEIAEVFDVFQEVSSVTGPIGAAIGAVVFVASDIFMAVEKVDKINDFVHLSEMERFVEGIRAFLGMKPEQKIQNLMAEKQVYQQLVEKGLEYLNKHPDIKRYVFPTGKSVVDTCRKVPYETSVCASGGLGGRCFKTRTVTRFAEECTTKFQVHLENRVLLDRRNTDIKWSRTKPDDPKGGELFCAPQGSYKAVPREGSYLCDNAIGITDLSLNKTGNYTLIDLGEGVDFADGFIDSPNIFIAQNGSKRYSGGNKDDIFVLQGSYVSGYFYGKGGSNTLDLSLFAPEEESLDVELHLGRVQNYYRNITFGMSEINKFIGRKWKQDQIYVTCDRDVSDIKYLDGQAGSARLHDHVRIYEKDCVYEMQLVIRPYTEIYNRALKGNFTYIVPPAIGTAKIDFIYTAEALDINNVFVFEYVPAELHNIEIRNMIVLNKTAHVITLNFSRLPDVQFNITISGASNPSYRLRNNTEIKVGNKGNLYMLQNTNQSVDEIIMNYLPLATRLKKVSFFIQSLLVNEYVVIGSGNHEIINNNPHHKSHLVGNGGENVYVIDIGRNKTFQTGDLPIPEVVIYDLDIKNSIDTIDLRHLTEKVRSISPNEDNFQFEVVKSGQDLLLKATINLVELTEYSSTSKIKEREYFNVRLKGGINWYNKTHVVVNSSVPMRISLNRNKWILTPEPLVFGKDKEIIVITNQDIEENNEIITPRRALSYTFARDYADDLLITNAFDVNVAEDDLCTIMFSKYYVTPKMETLRIKYTDKEIALKDHEYQIRTAQEVGILKLKHRNKLYSKIFNCEENGTVEIVPSVPPVADTKKYERSKYKKNKSRQRRSENITSGASRPFSFINGFFGWITGPIRHLLYSKNAVREQIANPGNSILQINTAIDINETILLLDLLIRKVTGENYIFSTLDQNIEFLEAECYGLNITERLEQVLNKTATELGISVTSLNFDPVVVQTAVVKAIRSGKYSEISKTLCFVIEKFWSGVVPSCRIQAHLKNHLKDILAQG